MVGKAGGPGRRRLAEAGRRGLGATFVLAAVLAGAAGCDRSGEAASEAAPRAVAERFRVVPRETPDLKPVAATITTRDMAEARARIGGTLTSLSVKAGDEVRRGQTIGMVRDDRVGLQTQAFDAQVQAAEAEAERARADLARTRDLFDHGVYAKARLEQVQAAARAAEGALKAARAQRGASAQTAAQGAILAPADGRVLRADVPAGSVVSPGQSVATLTAGPPVIRIETPEADAAGLKVGQTVALPAEAGAGAAAAIVQVYPAVQAGRVVADLGAPGLKSAFVGRRLTLQLPVGRRTALVVPRRFVTSRSGVDYVTVLGAGGALVEAPVQLAPGPSAGEAEVLSGLQPGDVLARAGS